MINSKEKIEQNLLEMKTTKPVVFYTMLASAAVLLPALVFQVIKLIVWVVN